MPGLHLLGLIAQFAPVAPESPNAEGIRDTWLFISIFVVAIFLLVESLLIAFIWRYRRQKRDRFEPGAEIHGAMNLELAWTAGPVLVLVLIAAFVFVELPGIKDVPEAAAGDEELEISVSGRQFYWQYEYPNGVIAVDRMRAPVGVPVRLKVTAPAGDVVHSWWIPALGGKIDAVPGLTNETWFQAEREGVYSGQCAELCGLEHARMLATVEVVSREEFAAWLESGNEDLGAETWAGACAKCHALSGAGGIGPRIAGSPTLTDVEDLGTLVRHGRRTMPAVGAGWSDEQVQALVTYLTENPPDGSES